MAVRPKRGRPPKFAERSTLIAVRLPNSLLDRLDRYAPRLVLQGRSATRSDAVRYLLERALRDREQAERELKETFGEVTKALVGTRPRQSRRRT